MTPVDLTAETLAGLNRALDEALLLGVEVESEERVAGVTLAVLTLPDDGPVPDDRRVLLVLGGVGRVAASLRRGRWDDETADVVPFEIGDLFEVVKDHLGCSIYGASSSTGPSSTGSPGGPVA